jgi:hypothetical protein
VSTTGYGFVLFVIEYLHHLLEEDHEQTEGGDNQGPEGEASEEVSIHQTRRIEDDEQLLAFLSAKHQLLYGELVELCVQLRHLLGPKCDCADDYFGRARCPASESAEEDDPGQMDC